MPGPHDFAVRFSAARLARLPIAHRLSPALRSRCARNAAASTASHPNVRDDREPPLFSEWDGESCKSDLGQSRSDLFFVRGLDRNSQTLPVGQISWRKRARNRCDAATFFVRPVVGGIAPSAGSNLIRQHRDDREMRIAVAGIDRFPQNLFGTRKSASRLRPRAQARNTSPCARRVETVCSARRANSRNARLIGLLCLQAAIAGLQTRSAYLTVVTVIVCGDEP